MSETLPTPLARLRMPSLLVGVIALGVCVIGLVINPAEFFIAYLYAFLFWLGISLGTMAFAMLHWLVNGRWGFLIRRFQEAAMGLVPLMVLFFLPVAFAVHLLYPWASPERLAGDALIRHKAPYLNLGFWIVRAAIYFAVWSVLALVLRYGSDQVERSDNPATKARLQSFAAFGILVYIVTMTYASVDWNMSREPHYYSTIFGFIAVVGQALEGMAFVVLMLMLVAREKPFDRAIKPQAQNDLGSLLFTLVILIAYMEFAQYLVNWSGNMQTEISWYVARNAHAWWWVSAGLIVFHFFVPFFLLLSRRNKRNVRVLACVAFLLLLMRLLHMYWMIAPSGTADRPHLVTWVAVVFAFLTPLGIGGVWFAGFLWLLGRRSLLPEAALQEEGHTHGE